jgi:hypothetical protein
MNACVFRHRDATTPYRDRFFRPELYLKARVSCGVTTVIRMKHDDQPTWIAPRARLGSLRDTARIDGLHAVAGRDAPGLAK